MIKDLWRLSKSEELDREKYLAGGKKTFATPLSFSEFSQFSQAVNKTALETFYRKTSKNGAGLTIVKNDLFNHEPIYVSVHPRYSYPVLHNHEFIELIYVYHGECINYVEGQAVHMLQGTICFMAPETVHALVALDDDDIIINILLYKEAFTNYFNDMLDKKTNIADFLRDVIFGDSESPYILFKSGFDNELNKLFLRIFLESQKKESEYEEMIALYLRMIFIHLQRYHSNSLVKPNKVSKEKSGIIAAIINYIAIHCVDITLKKLALVFSYSETYLSKLIKEHTGKTFRELLESDRLEQAQYLIENTTMSLTDISHQVGYFDYSHMSKSFRNALGTTPKSLRKK